MSEPLLSVRDLCVSLPGKKEGEWVKIVRGVSFEVAAGRFHALVGESGCGKSLTAMAIGRLPPTDTARLSGSVRFAGREILTANPREMRAVRRDGGMAFVFQEPISALNPVLRIGAQMREALPPRTGKKEGQALIRDLLREVGLADAERILRAYPHELSGGMAQRVCLAMALAQRPALLIADEPTTALDVLVQRKVLDLLRDVCRARGIAAVVVTHNLAVVAEYADTLSVLYAGQVVEAGAVSEVLAAPAHPYTAALLRAVPRLESQGGVEYLATIPGRVPPPSCWDGGACTFAERCSRADMKCKASSPPWTGEAALSGVRCFRSERKQCHPSKNTNAP